MNKIVSWLVSPVCFFFAALAASWILRRIASRRERAGRPSPRIAKFASCVAWSSLAILYVASCGVSTRFLGLPLEAPWSARGVRHGDTAGVPQADAIVVLGGGMALHAKCGAPEMNSGADRVWHGARLYAAGKAPVVVATGPDANLSTLPLLVDLGVPADKVLFVDEARNTEEEAKLSFRLLSGISGEGRAPSIVLVTSAWHMDRAKLLFEKAGFDVAASPSDFDMNCACECGLKFSDFFPSADALLRNTVAIKEWVGGFAYRLRFLASPAH